VSLPINDVIDYVIRSARSISNPASRLNNSLESFRARGLS
jgi:hypothetical protein